MAAKPTVKCAWAIAALISAASAHAQGPAPVGSVPSPVFSLPVGQPALTGAAGVAVDTAANVYFAQTAVALDGTLHSEIVKVSPDGRELMRFGPGAAAPRKGRLVDVDGDGDRDLLVHFDTQDSAIACGDASAGITGAAGGGIAIAGTDSIRTVGCR